jgi:GTP cyclohydrolase II
MGDDYLRYLGSRVQLKSRRWGNLTFESVNFTSAVDGDLAVYIGNPLEQERPLVRIHSECVFGEMFDSELCDCADQFSLAMHRLREEGHGILFYLRLDGRGAGLAAKVKATALEVEGMDTYKSRIAIGVPPEGRDFRAVGDFLKSKNVNSVRLLTNNPNKAQDLERAGVVATVEPLIVKHPSHSVMRLYETKRQRFGHLIPDEVIYTSEIGSDPDGE